MFGFALRRSTVHGHSVVRLRSEVSAEVEEVMVGVAAGSFVRTIRRGQSFVPAQPAGHDLEPSGCAVHAACDAPPADGAGGAQTEASNRRGGARPTRIMRLK
eukprot:2206287-Pleurochrysis_carterae.AAC.1